jgi:hypothetical protein
MNLVCKNCGKEYLPKGELTPSRIKRSKFCSHACAVKYNRKHSDFGNVYTYESKTSRGVV